MKITKYPQSCLMIETNNKRILIDPGSLKYENKYLEKWKKADIILLTHKHFDHVNLEVLKNLSLPIYSSNEVKETYKELNINIVKENDVINLDNINIEVVKAIHGYNPLLKNGGEVFENIGFIIDDTKTRFYITSDTICFNNDFKVDVIALPVTGYGLTMTSFEAALFIEELEAKLALPIHMDNEKYPTDKLSMKENFEKFNINYQVLNIEDTIEI